VAAPRELGNGEPSTLILSGAGEYADPWHAFPETSGRLADVLAGVGCDVEIAENLPERLSDLDDVDLLVVNAAAGPSGSRRADVERALEGFLARGGGILAVHVGVCSLLDLPGWPDVSGAAWIPSRTMHPPLGSCRIDVRQSGHPVSAALSSFEVVDERYSHLDLRPGSDVLASHTHDGAEHPLVWAREIGPGRVVADALGHGPESYDSAGHRALIRAAAGWLIERRRPFQG
jgi:type 1 glutamine amidotransferase